MGTTETEVIYLPLENVDSEHCAMIVQNSLSKVSGITEAKVELNNHLAIIQTTDEAVAATAIQTVKDLGYGVTTIKKTFPVLGMSCASCAASAESSARYVHGVVQVSVNFATGNLTVEYLHNMKLLKRYKRKNFVH